MEHYGSGIWSAKVVGRSYALLALTGMKITGVTGISEAQKAALRAVEE
jgi:hypothetical protein